MSSPKVDLAINRVKGLIQTGESRSAERLPTEAELSAKLGVSHNSLREAVRAMQAMRILEARQGDGTYVSDLDPSGMVEVLRFAVDVSDACSVYWFLETRRTLEVQALEAAAVRRSTEDIRTLRALHERTLAESDPEELMLLDTHFHAIIAEIAGNPVQTALLKVVSAPILRARIWRQRMADHDYSDLRNEHSAILRGIERQDVQEARFAMWGHVSGMLDWVDGNQDALSMSKVRQ